VNLSRRIKSENERNLILIKPAGMGFAGSHGSGGKPEEAVIEDLEVLQNNGSDPPRGSIHTTTSTAQPRR